MGLFVFQSKTSKHRRDDSLASDSDMTLVTTNSTARGERKSCEIHYRALVDEDEENGRDFVDTQRPSKIATITHNIRPSSNNNNVVESIHVDRDPISRHVRYRGLLSKSKSSMSSSRSVSSISRQSSWVKSRDVTLEHVPDFILGLEAAVSPRAKWPLYVLRLLFALSESSNQSKDGGATKTTNTISHHNRVEMVRMEGGRLVPTLLTFLARCQSGSPEHHWTLLVLNNLSIPMENKKVIALEHGGADKLAQMLCDDPSCHLMAVILVNLTFAGDDEFRKELISSSPPMALVESLSFVLRISSLTRDEYEARISTIEECNDEVAHSPADRLSILMAEDHRLRPPQARTAAPIVDCSQQIFPETARWCLAALRNLSKPCQDVMAAHILIKSGTLSLIIQFITISETCGRSMSTHSSSDLSTVLESDPVEGGYRNQPFEWVSQSSQDMALAIVLNLSECSASREYMNERGAVKALASIAGYPKLLLYSEWGISFDQKQHMDLSCLKARMALSYLIGSEGHFGQSNIRRSASTAQANPNNSELVMSDSDVDVLLDLLANTLHRRGKNGPGGYSSTALRLKSVLFALRCLLTHTRNQENLARLVGPQLNTLLMKALAVHALDPNSAYIDDEVAEHACFSLYLQSNYGFQDMAFLPCVFAGPGRPELNEFGTCGDLAAKILVSYLCLANVRPAGRHAAEQLLLRLRFMTYGGEMNEITGRASFLHPEDLALDAATLSQLKSVKVGKIKHGAKPSPDIFHRPVLRYQGQRRDGTERGHSPPKGWGTVSVFANALMAVQQLSYGSIRVRHVGPIDDIQIANNIVSSANGERLESYHFLWHWEDKMDEIERNLERPSSREGRYASLFRRLSGQSKKPSKSTNEPVSIFGFGCGPICAIDTTTE